MGYLSTDKKKITTKTFAEMKKAGEKVTMLTAYDFTTAGIIDAAGIDSILIGDSASNVMAGNADTLPITVDQMIYHARSVARACQHAFVVCDMPFGSYQIDLKIRLFDMRNQLVLYLHHRLLNKIDYYYSHQLVYHCQKSNPLSCRCSFCLGIMNVGLLN